MLEHTVWGPHRQSFFSLRKAEAREQVPSRPGRPSRLQSNTPNGNKCLHRRMGTTSWPLSPALAVRPSPLVLDVKVYGLERNFSEHRPGSQTPLGDLGGTRVPAHARVREKYATIQESGLGRFSTRQQ